MNRQKSSWVIASILFLAMAILLGACGAASGTTPSEPLSSPILPTETPLPAVPSPTPVIPTDTLTPVPPTPVPPTPLPPTQIPLTLRPTSVPGTKFVVASGDLELELEIHACNMMEIGFGTFKTSGIFDGDVRSMMDFTEKIFKPGQALLHPKPGDAGMCWMKGTVLEGLLTETQISAWVDEGTVYLLDQAGSKSELIYAGLIPDEQAIFLLFSAPEGYVPNQIAFLDELIDIP